MANIGEGQVGFYSSFWHVTMRPFHRLREKIPYLIYKKVQPLGKKYNKIKESVENDLFGNQLRYFIAARLATLRSTVVQTASLIYFKTKFRQLLNKYQLHKVKFNLITMAVGS